MEAHPEELLYTLGERASQDGQQAHRRPGDRLLRRSAADRARRGAEWKTFPEVQQATDVPQPETGECHHIAQVPRDRRGNQDRQYR